MRVVIMLDRAPTAANRKLLNYLLQNVANYRTKLRMRITTVPKRSHKTLDKRIKKLPAAFVGTRLVMGPAAIIGAIKGAFTQVNAVPQDPVRDFMRTTMLDGLDPGMGGVTGGRTPAPPPPSPDESHVVAGANPRDLAKRFTSETQRRQNQRNSLDPRKRQQSTGESPSASRAPSKRNQRRQRSKPPSAHPASAPSSATPTEYISATDPNRPSAMDDDPFMKMYWANQEVTPGT